MTRDMATAVSVPLDVHCATITACLNNVARADSAAAELRHYTEKVEAMDLDQEQTAPDQTTKRAQRNCEKLQKVRHVTSISQACARDAVGKCLLRSDQLSRTAEEALMTSVKALSCMVPDMNLGSAGPFEDTNGGEEILQDNKGHISNQVGTAPLNPLNPFETDDGIASANGLRGGADGGQARNPFEQVALPGGALAAPTSSADEARDPLETNPFCDDLHSPKKDVGGPACSESIILPVERREPSLNPFEDLHEVNIAERDETGSNGLKAQKGCWFLSG